MEWKWTLGTVIESVYVYYENDITKFGCPAEAIIAPVQEIVRLYFILGKLCLTLILYKEFEPFEYLYRQTTNFNNLLVSKKRFCQQFSYLKLGSIFSCFTNKYYVDKEKNL